MDTAVSRELFDRALRTLPGGVGGNARSRQRGFTPFPLMMQRGTGPFIEDVDGNRYIDYLGAFGPLILGHRPPAVVDAVTRTIRESGTIFGFGHRLEIEAAEAVVDAVPSWEMVRFANTGSEAVLAALRMARAYTGRTKVLKFEGHYHGWPDEVFVSTLPPLDAAGPDDCPSAVPASQGIPDTKVAELVIRQWNEPDGLRRTFQSVGPQLAAVICEPVMTNCSVIPPRPGFLELLRELTHKHGVVLIFDEIKTGFRLARGGAQEFYGVLPDLSVAAKAIAGGFPLAAVGGTRALFEPVADNRVVHSATYHSNPPAMAACLATQHVLAQPGFYADLNSIAKRMADKLAAAARETGISAHVAAVGSLQQIVFAERRAMTYRDLIRTVDPTIYRAFWRAMLSRGVILPPTQFQNYYISHAHSIDLVDQTVQIAHDALIEMANSRPQDSGV